MPRCEEGRGGSAEDQTGFSYADVTVSVLDLASLASVRFCAASLLEAGKALDLLIDNAGVMAFPTRQTTADGLERQFGTNHLGHFASPVCCFRRCSPRLRAGSTP
jgi:NAD(P)-dependent dehydrogenase (short-subunit alcohol dehydrogenase family)